MSFIKVYIHFVWSTKNRYPFLDTKEKRYCVWTHIKENALKKDIYIDFVNGYSDHCHCLVSLGVDQTIQNTVKLIKGESSFWINQQGFVKDKFEWQDEYLAVSVSESRLDIVRNYIKNQEVHHNKKSFNDEYNEFIKRYKFEKFKDE